MKRLRPITWMTSCAVGTLGGLLVPSVPQAQPADAKRFEIVECVMPATARKRGRNFSEIVRGGIRTVSAEECENYGGTYVPVTALEATANLFRPEAERGDRNAQYRMGSILEQGIRGVPDIPAAIAWYQKAAAQGDLRARASLVRLAQDGKWQASEEEISKLMGLSFGDGLAPLKSERDTLREQLAAATAALEQMQAKLKQSTSQPGHIDAAAQAALVAEVQRLRDINETYRQRMALVEKVNDRLRLQLGTAPAARDIAVALTGSASGGDFTIEIFDPPVPATRGARVAVSTQGDGGVRVIGRALSPAGIRSLSVNEKPLTTRMDGSFEIRQPLTRGTAKFIVKATDGASRTRQIEFELVATTSPVADRARQYVELNPEKLGNYHALIIGNNAYRRGWPPLQTAVADATRMAGILKEHYGFQVTLLTEVDRYGLLTALNALRQKLTENDNLLIYYAGHGQIDSTTGAAYWVPVDGEETNPSNWVSASEITNMLLAMKAKNVLIIADSCYGGAFSYRTIPSTKPDLDLAARGAALTKMSGRKSRTILTSGGNEPVLDSSDGKHSLFAAQLLPLLEQNQQPMEASRLFMALAVRVHESAKALTKGAVSAEYSNQIPYYAALEHAGHEMGDFVFVPRRK